MAMKLPHQPAPALLRLCQPPAPAVANDARICRRIATAVGRMTARAAPALVAKTRTPTAVKTEQAPTVTTLVSAATPAIVAVVRP